MPERDIICVYGLRRKNIFFELNIILDRLFHGLLFKRHFTPAGQPLIREIFRFFFRRSGKRLGFLAVAVVCPASPGAGRKFFRVHV